MSSHRDTNRVEHSKEDVVIDFTEFRESTRVKNLAIQHVLRQIDTGLLSLALVGLSEEDRNIFTRNMSVRAAGLLEKEIAELEEHSVVAYRERSEKAQETLLMMLEKRLSASLGDEELTSDEVPPMRWKTEAELIETFTQLKRYTRRHGAVSIESAIAGEMPPLLKKGLELYVDGWDPSLAQSILEQMKESLIKQYINKQNMILEGVGALTGHDVPQAVEEKLRAFRLSDT
jgi:flagellar motor component MotA